MTTDRKAAPVTTTRRERRANEREAQRSPTRRTARRSPWRSPMVLMTLGALVVGGAIVSYALLTQSRTPTDTLYAPTFDVPAAQANGRELGSPNAPVVVDIWADFQCPGCRQLATLIEPPIITQFVVPGYARLVFHDAAFQGAKVNSSWDESVQPAAAARCAADQGRFWQMHDWLFANWNGENQGGFRPDRLRQIAQSAELDMSAYDRCMAVGDKQAAVKADTKAAVADGINSTPTVRLNGQTYTGQMTVKGLGDAIMAVAAGASPAPMPQSAPTQ